MGNAITDRKLRAAGYDRVLVSCYEGDPARFEYVKRTENENRPDRVIEVYMVPVVFVCLIEGNKKIEMNPKNMAQLRSLEEIFLS